MSEIETKEILEMLIRKLPDAQIIMDNEDIPVIERMQLFSLIRDFAHIGNTALVLILKHSPDA